MSRPDPAAAMNGTRIGNICSGCNKRVRTGDLIRGYVTHYERDGWLLRRLWCEDCGDTTIERGTEGADEAIIEALYWNQQPVGVSVLDRSFPEI